MEWPLILALALLVPCVLMPAFFIWYLNKGGVAISIKFARTRPARSVTTPDGKGTGMDEYEQLVFADLQRHLKNNPPVLE